MKKTRLHKLQIFTITAMFLVFGYASGAWALAFYDAFSTLSIGVSVTQDTANGGTLDDLEIFADVFAQPFATTTGIGFADPSGFVDFPGFNDFLGFLSDGDLLEMEANPSGDAQAPPDSTSAADYSITGFFDIGNFSYADTYTVSFQFDWDASVEASIDNPFPAEDALAESSLFVESFQNFDAPVLHIDEIVQSDPVFGPGGIAAAIRSFEVAFVLAPGDFAVIDVFNDNIGFAKAVPEPGTLLLLGAGLIGLAGIGRRRVKA